MVGAGSDCELPMDLFPSGRRFSGHGEQALACASSSHLILPPLSEISMWSKEWPSRGSRGGLPFHTRSRGLAKGDKLF